MTRSHIDTVREYWAAGDREDWEAAGRCVGSGFTWIDHTWSDAPMDDALAVAEVQAWSDSTRVIDEWDPDVPLGITPGVMERSAPSAR